MQERWFASLYLLKPVVLGALALFWIVSGLLALGPGWSAATRIMAESVPTAAPLYVMAGSAADIAVGMAIAVRRTARAGLLTAIGVSLLYLLLGTALSPALWLDPLGPLVKALRILVLHLVAQAIVDER